MIPHPHRQKGGAPQLGARQHGEHGPFGPYGGWNEDDDQDDDGLDGSDSVGDSDPKQRDRSHPSRAQAGAHAQGADHV